MALIRWSPFDAFAALERDMQEMRDRFPMAGRAQAEPVAERAWRPRVDVFREKEALVVRAELPGIDPEKDIEVSVEDNVLRIAGHRAFGREVDEKDFYLCERSYGSFRRDIVLPEGVNTDALEAHFENGVLTLRIPLPVEVEAGSRRIPITIGEQSQTELEAGSEE